MYFTFLRYLFKNLHVYYFLKRFVFLKKVQKQAGVVDQLKKIMDEKKPNCHAFPTILQRGLL